MTRVIPERFIIDDRSTATLRVPFHLRILSGKQLHCRYWFPKDPPRALVMIVHDFAEHIGYYEELADRLTLKGSFFVFGHDHVGHGRSDGPRIHVNYIDEYVEDVLIHAHLMQREYPDLTTFAIGHSMGGLILLSSTLKEQFTFNGVVLMSPLIYLDTKNKFTPFKVLILNFLSRIAPQLIVAPLNLLLITRDRNFLDIVTSDRYFWSDGFKCKWTKAVYDSLLDLNKKGLASIKVPFLVLHGEGDQLCNPKGSALLYEQASVEDKTLKIMPSALHNLYHELPEIREESLTDTVTWIMERIPETIYIDD